MARPSQRNTPQTISPRMLRVLREARALLIGFGALFLAAVRQSVYQRSLALSTRHLEIQYTPLGDQAGLIGAGVLAMHEALKGRGVAP